MSGKTRAAVVGYIDAILEIFGLLAILGFAIGALVKIQNDSNILHEDKAVIDVAIVVIVGILVATQSLIVVAAVRLIQSTEEISAPEAVGKVRFWNRVQVAVICFSLVHLVFGFASLKNEDDMNSLGIAFALAAILVRIVFYLLVMEHVGDLEGKVSISSVSSTLAKVNIPYKNLV